MKGTGVIANTGLQILLAAMFTNGQSFAKLQPRLPESMLQYVEKVGPGFLLSFTTY